MQRLRGSHHQPTWIPIDFFFFFPSLFSTASAYITKAKHLMIIIQIYFDFCKPDDYQVLWVDLLASKRTKNEQNQRKNQKSRAFMAIRTRNSWLELRRANLLGVTPWPCWPTRRVHRLVWKTEHRVGPCVSNVSTSSCSINQPSKHYFVSIITHSGIFKHPMLGSLTSCIWVVSYSMSHISTCYSLDIILYCLIIVDMWVMPSYPTKSILGLSYATFCASFNVTSKWNLLWYTTILLHHHHHYHCSKQIISICQPTSGPNELQGIVRWCINHLVLSYPSSFLNYSSELGTHYLARDQYICMAVSLLGARQHIHAPCSGISN